MARVYQVPQHTFVWLVATVFLAALPHFPGSPVWLTGIVVGALAWRVMIQRGRLSMPGRLVRFLLLVAAVGATLWSYGTLFGPEAGVCLLVAAFSLKTLEMVRLRDAYVVIVLAYFVLATVFLVDRGIVATLYVLAVLLVVTAALVGVNHAETGVRARSHARVAGVLVAQALPLTLVLFVFVPRISPLWTLELEQGQARTGMSDSMAPGEVSRLSQSDELAFRVEFESDIPPQPQRYWRGLTYSWFEGGRWSQAVPRGTDKQDYLHYPGQSRQEWYARLLERRSGEGIRYRVVMEPSRQRWLYALAVPFPRQPGIGLARDMRLVNDDEVIETFSYRVSSYPALVDGPELTSWERDLNLHLPENGNPRTRARAREWRAEAASDRAFAERVLRWFSEERFWYTLQPPGLQGDTVDAFLFETRRGFCEHYASAFTFMMRAAGIPARIVAGYQGGEVNPMGNHVRVRQRDAHAWAEIWLPDSGWTQFDPTGAVAPSRIEYGIDRALAEQDEAEGGALDALRGLRDNNLVRRLRHLSDYMEFVWQKWVLGYNQSTQLDFLKRWLGEVSPTRIALALLVTLALVLTPLAVWVLLSNRMPGLSWWQREYWRMVSLLRRRGLDIEGAAAPRNMAAAVGRVNPAAAEPMRAWSRYYEGVIYGERKVDAREARRQLRRHRRLVGRRLRRL